jgi:(1->4)-alpha-D-glucan 1-alpha-D-glucosylmutase
MKSLRIPISTYRLQFNRRFRFKDAELLVPYLHRLGISDLYASPIFSARRGSTHGYDVTDPTHLNPELGTETEFNALIQELKRYGMGLLLDIVPNHMAASPENPWWQDVLTKGNNSRYADYFDVNWLDFDKDRSKQTGHRRFFDIGDLVGIRVEDPRVFEATHSLIFKLIADDKITGLRIDHIDGLYDPLEYLLHLQQHIAQRANNVRGERRFYLLVEKILAFDETLPEEWPVSGTTGYDFTNMLNALFVNGDGIRYLGKIYSRFTGEQFVFTDVVYKKKKQVMEELFPEEMKSLGRYLAHLNQNAGHMPRLRIQEAPEALVEVTACMPVYRTYMRTREASRRDRMWLEYAFHEAERRGNVTNTAALDFLRHVFLSDFSIDATTKKEEEWQDFKVRWQQLTGAIMAKGFEDTALYCYNRLISLNEVGGQPDSSGLSVDEFHQHNLVRLKHCPHSLNATSTHDTKRSEDVRARLNVLSEIPEEWEERLIRWHRRNKAKKSKVNGRLVPESNMEIFLYQTLLGAWPFSMREAGSFKKRLKEYMIKAAREAKEHTNWLQPNQEYEGLLIRFIESILETSEKNEFFYDFLQLQRQIAYYGALNSLSQVLLKITSPGVPDFYQGMELWDFSLVDPDNRRPVNFDRRIKLLDKLIQQERLGQQSLIERIMKSWQDGRVKLYVTYKALDARRADEDIFQDGSYVPLPVEGKRQEHVGVFARNRGEKWAITAVPRFLTGLVEAGDLPCGQKVWGDDIILLPGNTPRYWLNVFTGEKLRAFDGRKGLYISEIFNIFPVALLKGV